MTKIDRTEAIRKFILDNSKFLLDENYDRQLMRRRKREFFTRKGIRGGVPRDREIAEETIRFLMKRGEIKDENKLQELLELPFLKKNISNKETLFAEFRISQGSEEPPIDIIKLKDEEYKKRVAEEIKEKIKAEKEAELENEFARRKEKAEDELIRKRETIERELKKEREEIEKEIERKKKKYDELPSVLDEQEFKEPAVDDQTEDEYFLWWRKLHLRSDPFPTQEGLAKIADSLYEQIVYKTSIFNQFVNFIEKEKSELFKNTIFFGQFGSGKTTLFDYLEKPLINERIHSIYIHLYAEKDFYTLLMKFRMKFFEGLCEVHQNVTRVDPRDWYSDSNLEDSIRQLLESLKEQHATNSYIVFVDDLHKNKDAFEAAMQFINYLQSIKAELQREIEDLRICFFVAGAADWDILIKNDPKFSGSYYRHEPMPPITEKTAFEVLNRRLKAFSMNPEAKRTIDLAFIEKMFRALRKKKHPITFRSFIKMTLEEFEKGNFSILQADPIHIKEEVIEEIRKEFEADLTLKQMFRNLVFGGGIDKQENRKRCLELLIKTYLRRGFNDSDVEVQENPFCFQRLAKSKLIQKMKIDDTFKWVVCEVLLRTNRRILKKHDLSMEDYLPKLYTFTRVIKKRKDEIHKEIRIMNEFIETIPISHKTFRDLIARSRDLHSEVIEARDSYVKAVDLTILKKCESSLISLTQALAVYENISLSNYSEDILKEFWLDFYFAPSEVIEFVDQIRDTDRIDQRLWVIINFYLDTYNKIFSHIYDVYKKSISLRIPLKDLTNEEIKDFEKIRDFWMSQDYFRVADEISRFLESKLRTFLYNVFTILSGDSENRKKMLDKESRNDIYKNIKKTKDRGFPIGDNEFQFLNRGNYKNFMVGVHGSMEGKRNWNYIFKHVFAPMSESEFESFLSSFADMNITTSHLKTEAITDDEHTRVFSYLRNCLEVTKMMNRAYFTLLENGLQVVDMGEGKTPRFACYFSFCEHKDIEFRKPIFVKKEIADRIGDDMKQNNQLSINIEDYKYIMSFFQIGYRDFYAICARSLSQTDAEIEKSKMEFSLKRTKGCHLLFNIRNFGEDKLDQS